ncbi:caa(3)-type oxidase, subunit IV [Caenispirillum salinarum AK4]|uniref:Caa(3)-type oxidase, subunit IV n=1 Tax=Caenispirillum salinarum AK4 TaxID=1238182 RepID=K9GU99_9PROT|nr:cytochrome C oxidase subunit IV family protein [Caenispirillum salinarum]EKV29540.1 caa(3)-type oxidase, subunit IV [Caenispirillum salinarum AK4]
MADGLSDRQARQERRLIVKVYGGLMGLLGLTLAVAMVDLGWGNVVANLSIAVAKTILILWVFMHLREATPMLRLFAVAAVMWVGFLIVLGLSDWMTRGGS